MLVSFFPKKFGTINLLFYLSSSIMESSFPVTSDVLSYMSLWVSMKFFCKADIWAMIDQIMGVGVDRKEKQRTRRMNGNM